MTGQLSDDGNFMWNGNEWVPVEQQAAPAAPMAAAEPMAAAAPMVVSPHTDMGMAAAPAATVMVATSGSSSGGGLDFTRGFSTLKYGLAAFISSILTMILISSQHSPFRLSLFSIHLYPLHKLLALCLIHHVFCLAKNW